MNNQTDQIIASLMETPAPSAWPQAQWPQDFWAMVFDRLPFLMLVFDLEGRLLLANDEAVKHLDLSEAPNYVLPEGLKALKAGAHDLEKRGSRSRLISMKAPIDGSPLCFTLKHLPYGEERGLILAIGQKRGHDLAQTLKISQSLDETAALATAVRRQMTGPLAGIELYASILGQELQQAGDSNLYDLTEEIRFGLREVNEYLSSINSMAQPLCLNLETHNLADVVDEAIEAMSGVFKEKGIGLLTTQKSMMLQLDHGLMVQVFLNLFLNAVEAMPQGGRLFIEFDVNQNGQAQVIVTDTGSGVPLGQMRQIFSPFYTTKNQPLGLGLPVSHRIIEAHQGHLVVGSDLNLGARAVVTLPYLPDPEMPSFN